MSGWIEFNHPWNVRCSDVPEFPGRPEYPSAILDQEAVQILGFNSNDIDALRQNLPPYSDSFDEDPRVIYYREQQSKLVQFQNAHPLCIEYDAQHKLWQTNYKEFKRNWYKENKPSFCALGLDKAGTLIQFRQCDEFGSSEQVIQYLIGNINESGGICDDCRGIEDTDIILRYKVIWSKEEN